MREESGGIDSENFFNWAIKFVESVSGLTADGRYICFLCLQKATPFKCD